MDGKIKILYEINNFEDLAKIDEVSNVVITDLSKEDEGFIWDIFCNKYKKDISNFLIEDISDSKEEFVKKWIEDFYIVENNFSSLVIDFNATFKGLAVSGLYELPSGKILLLEE